MSWNLVRSGLIAALLPLFGAALAGEAAAPRSPDAAWKLATFSIDVTVPLGHRLMGILPTKSQEVEDPLFAVGCVWLSDRGPAVVLVAVDWCEIRNGAYDAWRDAAAAAAGTTRERVLVCSLHQHDAPVTDNGAQDLLDQAGLPQALFDREFQSGCLRRLAEAIREAIPRARTITHVGRGSAPVHEIGSSRRMLRGSKADYGRGSSSGADPACRAAPEGSIDPLLRTISFWDGDTALAAIHCYATHPMSRYGSGKVSADFPGLARMRRQIENPQVLQIYLSGCSGDVTAGKYNDASPPMRAVLADRLHRAMRDAWSATQRHPWRGADFRTAPLHLPYRDEPGHRREHLAAVLSNAQQPERERILAAMALSSLDRVERRQPIDVACLDLGPAQIVLLPGESFVGYQLLAQRMRPDSLVMTVGYGECWPGYIPTDAAFEDGFTDVWLWVGRGSEARMVEALRRVLFEKPAS